MRNLFTILVAITIVIGNHCLAQAPQKMSYQAVIRDAGNVLVINQAVAVRVSIIQGSLFGPSVYVETHAGNTNANGLVTLEIGTGTILNGAFNTIDWSQGPYFLKTETDPTGGNNFSIAGTAQLMSVPYALYAEESGTPGPVGPQGPQGQAGPQGPSGAANINGTQNYLVRFTSATTGGNSIIRDDGFTASIGTSPNPFVLFNVEGNTSDPLILASNAYGPGIEAQTQWENSTALWGMNYAPTSTGYGNGVLGGTDQSGGAGVAAYNQNSVGTGVMGAGNNFNSSYLLAGSGGAFTGGRFGCVGIGLANSSGVVRAGGYFVSSQSASYAYVGALTTANTVRKIEGNGTVNTTVKGLNDELVVLSCPEAPENLFEDYGKGQLQVGHAHIDLDPIFAKNIIVDGTHDLRVFIQLEGDCNGVFVTSKTQSGFDVQELASGSSNTAFTYHVIANRADETLPDGTISKYSAERFAPAMGPQATEVSKYDTTHGVTRGPKKK